MERHEIESDLEETPDDDWVDELCEEQLEEAIHHILDFTVMEWWR